MCFSCKSVVSNLHHPFLEAYTITYRCLMKSIKAAGTTSITGDELEISCRLKRLERDITLRHYV